jgi:hypothetical protein
MFANEQAVEKVLLTVILSPSLTVTLSEAKSLIPWLRINSAKNLGLSRS